MASGFFMRVLLLRGSVMVVSSVIVFSWIRGDKLYLVVIVAIGMWGRYVRMYHNAVDMVF